MLECEDLKSFKPPLQNRAKYDTLKAKICSNQNTMTISKLEIIYNYGKIQ